MAFRQVAIIEPTEEKVVQKARKGWGKAGQALGAAVGGVIGGVAAGASTGGAGTAAGAMAGAATGASLGGMVGERLRSTREGQTAIERRAMAAPQMVQSESAEKLKQSISALSTQPPDVQKQYMKPLIEAYATTIQGSGGAT